MAVALPHMDTLPRQWRLQLLSSKGIRSRDIRRRVIQILRKALDLRHTSIRTHIAAKRVPDQEGIPLLASTVLSVMRIHFGDGEYRYLSVLL